MKNNPNQKIDVPVDWTEENSADFITFGGVFTPQKDRIHRIIRRIASTAPIGKAMAELGCGAGDLLRELINDDPLAYAYALDRSETMLAQARENCRHHENRIHFDLGELEDQSIPAAKTLLDVVVSVLAIHHLDNPQKVLLFGRVYDALRVGGVFIYCDMFRPASEIGWRIASEEWPIEVSEQGERYHVDGAVDAFERLKWNYYRDPDGDPSDKPASIAQTLSWLRSVGFRDVDLHWHSAGHGLLSARKIGDNSYA